MGARRRLLRGRRRLESLAAIQPEGAIAAESVRTEVKAAVREGARAAGR